MLATATGIMPCGGWKEGFFGAVLSMDNEPQQLTELLSVR